VVVQIPPVATCAIEPTAVNGFVSIGNVTAAEVAPPVLTTVTLAFPPAAIKPAGTNAVICVALA
jgi:hypothetical protein